LIRPKSFQAKSFIEWLEAQGAIVQTGKGQWEVFRYILPGQTVRVVFKKADGRVSLPTAVHQDYVKFQTFLGQAGEDAIEKTRSPLWAKSRRRIKRQCAQRDGLQCIICGAVAKSLDDLTLEHFVPQALGGKHNAANGGLACEGCNEILDALPVAQKILVRDKIRAARMAVPPYMPFDARDYFCKGGKPKREKP